VSYNRPHGCAQDAWASEHLAAVVQAATKTAFVALRAMMLGGWGRPAHHVIVVSGAIDRCLTGDTAEGADASVSTIAPTDNRRLRKAPICLVLSGNKPCELQRRHHLFPVAGKMQRLGGSGCWRPPLLSAEKAHWGFSPTGEMTSVPSWRFPVPWAGCRSLEPLEVWVTVENCPPAWQRLVSSASSDVLFWRDS